MAQEVQFAHVASGARIAWASQGRGPPLLRAAHWMTHVAHDPNSPVWQPWLSRLGRQLRVLRYDERGCGMSGPDKTPLDLETAVEELEAVADAAGLKRFALLGISGGAPAAIAYAARHPDRVSHLVLLGPYACGVMAGTPSAEQVAWVDATARLIELGWGRAGSPVQQFFTASLIPGGTQERVQSLNEQQRLCCGPERAAALLRARAVGRARPVGAGTTAGGGEGTRTRLRLSLWQLVFAGRLSCPLRPERCAAGQPPRGSWRLGQAQ